MFVDAPRDPRVVVPTTGSERAMLVDFLAAQRGTLELKCAGVSSPAARSVPPPTLSLLGLVRHLADVERRWFRRVLAGEPVTPRFSSASSPDADFDDVVPSGAEEAWSAWRCAGSSST
jgi:hypothetical protein